jgi:hypothetical protein
MGTYYIILIRSETITAFIDYSVKFCEENVQFAHLRDQFNYEFIKKKCHTLSDV